MARSLNATGEKPRPATQAFLRAAVARIHTQLVYAHRRPAERCYSVDEQQTVMLVNQS
jgi:hypothetical protein